MPAAERPSPRAHYEARIRAAALTARRLGRWHDGVAWVRVAVLLGMVVALYEACSARQLAAGGVGAAAFGAFVALSMVVAALARRRAEAVELEAYGEAGLARLEDRPRADAPTGEAFQEPDHLYAADLDLFGPRSLFALVSTARTPGGQRRLAVWLQAGAPAEELAARQAAVAELRDLAELRERLWLSAGPVKAVLGSEKLEAWVRVRPAPVRGTARLGALLLAVAGAVAVAAILAGRPLLALPVFLVQLLFVPTERARVAAVVGGAKDRADELKALMGLCAVVEGVAFRCEHLRRLQRALASEGGVPARRRVADLVRRVEWFESRRNPFFAIVSAPLLLGTQLAFAIDGWRLRFGEEAARWLDAAAALEALASLATFAHDHPEFPFPEVVANGEGPCFEARGLGHPLIPAATRVCNDVALTPATRLLLVTGSNMSGKSTLLRTIGVNAVLAQSGAPVCATHLRLSPLVIGASLRTADSLQAGVSRFFAEITRLRQILALGEANPFALYLLDEILHGTNSQDRFAGAEALVRALAARGAIGLCTTHDLALARIADELYPAAANVHFQDVIEGDKMSFDYQLRPGVVTRSNALALMRLVGLPV